MSEAEQPRGAPLPAPFRSRTIDVRGPLHFLEGGSGPPIVLVHGLGGSHVNWFAVAPRLAERRTHFMKRDPR